MELQPFINSGSSQAPTKVFRPQQTVRCSGPTVFRSQLVRDIACLLDVDDDVVSWSCFSQSFQHCGQSFRPDLVVERENSHVVVQATDSADTPCWLATAVRDAGFGFEQPSAADLPSIRLRNAKDLLRYATYEVALDDRVRLLAALEEHGTLTIAECLTVFRRVSAIPGLASLILSRIIAVDLDDALIGPETLVSRYRG